MEEDAVAQPNVIAVPGQVVGLPLQPHQPVDEHLVVVVVAQHQVELAAGRRGQQGIEPLGRPAHRAGRRQRQPAEVEDVAAEHENVGLGSGNGNLGKMPMGIRAIGK